MGFSHGRSGSRHWGVKPDLMCTAKAITNGYFPFGAVMISDAVAEAFESDTTGKGAIGSGYTYSGHPVGAAAAIACLRETERLQVKDNAAARGAQLFAGILRLKEKHEVTGDVRGGHGLMCALELVSDRKAKTPIDKTTIGQTPEQVSQSLSKLNKDWLFCCTQIVTDEWLASSTRILSAS